MCIDISSDSRLLVSGSADKTLKIWGLDFGDCHRSLLAHEDSVMQVRFVPDTHYVFSAGKDGAIKYWDADRVCVRGEGGGCPNLACFKPSPTLPPRI